MSKRTEQKDEVLLELWRPPRGAGEPIGCIATTYTFSPGLFDEQCLARFLDIGSEPNREDLAFLLERESKLGSVYAGVLVDYTQAGIEHSLRWYVLPVRISAGKQHAKISLLVWSQHIRIIIASANLTDPGYRTNYEVAIAVDLSPRDANIKVFTETMSFLRSLLLLVPGGSDKPLEVQKAETFLKQVERQARNWQPTRRGRTTQQHLAITIPEIDSNHPSQSCLDEAVEYCRSRGGSPTEVMIASPFFDANDESGRVTASLCKLMARGSQRDLCFCVPEIRSDDDSALARLAAPKTLIEIPPAYQGNVIIKILPDVDKDKNRRPWHAKMLALRSEKFSALMIGSSNFTCAGMGVVSNCNAEANLLTIIDRTNYNREISQIEDVWPEMKQIKDPEAAEWLGVQPLNEEEEMSKTPQLPAGFLLATYRAGDKRYIILRFAPAHLPEDWSIYSCGQDNRQLFSAQNWKTNSNPSTIEIAWDSIYPPEKLLVRWAGNEAFMPINVEDSKHLPPPAELEHMTADDMLLILASADPSAAFRVWAKRQRPSDLFDTELDAATPPDLDPLHRYDLQVTFLHRIRRKARILAQLRSNLQRPVWGKQALEWRLRGFIGIEPLADRLVGEIVKATGSTDEALLTLADFLIVLNEVDYQPGEDALSKADFDKVFQFFLKEMIAKLVIQVDTNRGRISKELLKFWAQVVKRCQG